MNAPLKLPPHSVEAEQSLIGALLLDNRAWDRIGDLLTDADFYRDDHRRIFRHISHLVGMGKPADVVTVFESIEKSDEVQASGGLAYLGEIANNTPSAANIRRYAEIVRDRATLRHLQAAGDALTASCAAPGVLSAAEIAAKAEAAIAQAVDREAGDPVRLVDVFGEALSHIDARGERGIQLAGLATGFEKLDRLTGGVEPGQLVVIAARPAVGKTMFGLNVADHVVKGGGTALFHSLEMTQREIGMRVLSMRTGVSVHAMRAGTRDEQHWHAFAGQLSAAEKHVMWIDDTPAVTVANVRAKARRIKRSVGRLDLVVIDYLQLMRGTGDNRTQEIGSISRGLKALAKELSVPVLVLAQLNRGVETRTDKRPLMSDLRDSGEVEQDADVVAMLHRESLYGDSTDWRGLAELIVRKNRNGPTGDMVLAYHPERMRFENFDGPNPRQQGGGAPVSQRRRRGFDE